MAIILLQLVLASSRWWLVPPPPTPLGSLETRRVDVFGRRRAFLRRTPGCKSVERRVGFDVGGGDAASPLVFPSICLVCSARKEQCRMGRSVAKETDSKSAAAVNRRRLVS
ncbi:hypothetical protein OPV22_006798 [Ensete ventricosum]|uniref:Secreted protein n=1 Tax=Ensete ventricosum TaxID=4639 RepID=A0AAV8QCL0_ENSVE|nr:hypothetical protein OPV22_006798 [Ensete ventricosum]